MDKKSVKYRTKRLKRFLKKHRCYYKFVKNMRNYNGKVISNIPELISVSRNPISAAFIFSETPEGYDYWRHRYDILSKDRAFFNHLKPIEYDTER